MKAIVVEYKPRAPVLEIGSLDINGTIRDLFPEPYLGLDMRAGPGVDVVSNILSMETKGGFNTVICCETLEHITRPWDALACMRAALDPGGLFIGTTVFAFPVHDYPSDYWRFTPEGLRYLLESIGFHHIRIDTEGEGPRGVFAVGER